MRPFLTLHSPLAARRYYEAKIWGEETLYGLLRDRAGAVGDGIALTDGRRAVTWRELLAWVDGIGFELRGYGLTTGDRVVGWMSSRMEGVAVFLACSREGFAYCPGLPPDRTCAEVADTVRRLTARALFVEPGWGVDRGQADFDAMLAGIPDLKAVFDTEFFPQPSTNLTRFNSDPDRVVYLGLGTGRGDEPTYAMHSDNTLLAGARDLVLRDTAANSDRYLLLTPLHDHAFWIHVALWLRIGCRLGIDVAAVRGDAADRILRHDPTRIVAAPNQVADILEACRHPVGERPRPSSILVTGTLVRPEFLRECRDAGLSLCTAYVTPESSDVCVTDAEGPMPPAATNDEMAITASLYRLFDPYDRDVEIEVGTVGHIGMRGPGSMLGYFDDQSRTERNFNEAGWFLSGDFGIADGEGRLSIVGRARGRDDDGGYVVDPTHLEALALRHPEVREAVCFTIPDKRLGARICIAVAGTIAPAVLSRHFEEAGLHRRDLPEFVVHLNALPGVSGDRAAKRALAEMARRQTLDLIPLSRIGTSVLRPAG